VSAFLFSFAHSSSGHILSSAWGRRTRSRPVDVTPRAHVSRSMLREIAKQVIPRSQWAATYVDTMPSMRHARGAARWGGVAVFGLFWMIGDPAFAWVASLGSSAEEET